MENDDVQLGTVQTEESYISTQADGDTEGRDLDLKWRNYFQVFAVCCTSCEFAVPK